MRHATARLAGVGAVALVGVVVLAWGLPTAERGAPVGASVDRRDAPQAGPPRQTTADAWLAAQPRAARPAPALPAGFWRGDDDARASAAAGDRLQLEIVGERGRQNVVLRDALGNTHELTGFTQPQHVYDAAASHDGRLAYVWHMAFAPRQVGVYDLETRQLLHRFAPGSGGRLRWAAGEPVILLETAGMGMGGARLTAFAIDGATILRTGVGAHALSPGDRWVLAVSWRDGIGRVDVFHTATGERALGAMLPAGVAALMVDPLWDEARGPMLRIVVDAERERAEVFELDRLAPILERAPGG